MSKAKNLIKFQNINIILESILLNSNTRVVFIKFEQEFTLVVICKRFDL